MVPAKFPKAFIYMRPGRISSAMADGLGSDQALGLKIGQLTSLCSQGPLWVEAAPFESQEDNTWTCVQETAIHFSTNSLFRNW